MAFQVMERLGKGEVQDKPKKVLFRDRENVLIAQHFANATVSETIPSLRECDKFLHGSGMNRDKKSVQDRAKNIIKKNKRKQNQEQDEQDH